MSLFPRSRLSFLFLTTLGFFVGFEGAALAGDPVGPGVAASNAYVDVMYLMREARDPSYTRAQKMKAAQRGIDYLRSTVGSQVPVEKVEDLPAYFAAHPELDQQLALNSSDGLGRVVTELNLLLQDIRVQDKLRSCTGSARVAGIRQGMAGHDPCQGKRIISSNVYFEVGKADGANLSEITVIFVPKDKIAFTQNLLKTNMGERAAHIKVEDIATVLGNGNGK